MKVLKPDQDCPDYEEGSHRHLEVNLSPRTDFVVFQEGEHWIAQCLQYDICVQSKSIVNLKHRIARTMIGNMVVAMTKGEKPFAHFQPAPTRYWKMYDQAMTVGEPFPLSPTREEIKGIPEPFQIPRGEAFMKLADSWM